MFTLGTRVDLNIQGWCFYLSFKSSASGLLSAVYINLRLSSSFHRPRNAIMCLYLIFHYSLLFLMQSSLSSVFRLSTGIAFLFFFLLFFFLHFLWFLTQYVPHIMKSEVSFVFFLGGAIKYTKHSIGFRVRQVWGFRSADS